MGFFQNALLATSVAMISTFSMSTNDAAASMKFQSNVIDLGEIEHNVPATAEFEFTNEGDEVLIISNVRTSCGCTVSEFPREPIAPGETNVIKAVYNAKSVGRFQKTITVISNSNQTTQVLTIKGTVKA